MKDNEQAQIYANDSFISRIRSLDANSKSGEELREALRSQDWVLKAIIDTEFDSGVKAAAENLNRLIGRKNSDPAVIKATCEHLLKLWTDSRHTYKSDSAQTINLAGWASLSAIVSTLFTILLGKEGLVTFLAQFTNTKPSPYQAPPKHFIADPFDLFIYGAHFCLLGLFLFLSFQSTNAQRKALDQKAGIIQIQANNQFWWGWISIQITWIALYFYLLIISLLSTQGHKLNSTICWSIADFLNIANAWCFYFTFLVLDRPSVATRANHNRGTEFRNSLILFTITSFIVVSLSILGRANVPLFTLGGPIFLSFFVAISMAYLFGRLDSHYLKISRWTLAPLYLYVAIQVTWSTFDTTKPQIQHYKPVMFSLALLLKAYFIWVIKDLIASGQVKNYIELSSEYYEKIQERLKS